MRESVKQVVVRQEFPAVARLLANDDYLPASGRI